VEVGDTPIGCVIFALPPRETARRYGGLTWELARLYMLDEVPPNAESWAIAAALRWVQRNHPQVLHVVSYADPSAGHLGRIYRASNFRADGRTDEERKTPRFDYADAVTGKHYSRRGHIPEGVAITRVPRVSKYRYVFTYTKKLNPDSGRH
jgi:hypothetical protein